MVERAERKWIWLFAAGIALATTLPYLVGFFAQGDSWRYTGLLIGAEDGNSYLAKMLRGSAGEWLFRTPYTPYPQNGFLAFLPYTLLGKLASGAGIHAQLVVLFHLFRVAGIFLLVLAVYRFVALFIAGESLRRWATALAVVGGGAGFLVVFGLQSLWGDRTPLEFYSPETFGFLGPLAIPHLAWARALLLLGLVDLLKTEPEGTPRARRLVPGGMWLALGLFQPLTVAVAWVVTGLYLAALAIRNRIGKLNRWDEWRAFLHRALLAGILSSPVVVYNFLSFRLDPFLSGWEQQNIILSPPIGDYGLAYGILFIPAIAGLAGVLRNPNSNELFPAVWVLAFPVLAYAPSLLQRRLPEGVWVALCVLGCIGIARMKGKVRQAALAWTSLGLITPLILLAGSILTVSRPAWPLFRVTDETRAFTCLGNQAAPNSLVLAAYDSSNALPAWAPLRVVIGHGPESLNLKILQPEVESVYGSAYDSLARKTWIDQWKIDYVFWGPEEKRLGNWEPPSENWLSRICQEGGYEVYAVLH